MTYGGTFTAILVYFVLLMAGGWFGWQGVTETTVTTNELTGETTYSIHLPSWLFVVALVAFGVAIVTIFKPKIAMFTGPIYAVAEGAVLGAISAMYNAQFDGIVLQAVLATMSVFAVMLFLYATRLVRVTKRMRMMVIGAMFAILLLYLGTFIVSLFGVKATFLTEPSLFSIGISLLIVGVASFNLMLAVRPDRVGRRGQGASLHGVVRRLRPDDRPRVALPGDPATAGPAQPSLKGNLRKGGSPGARHTSVWSLHGRA